MDMASRFSYKSYFATAGLVLLLSGGCTDETARYRGTEGETGKVVTVSMQVSLPPALEPVTKAADSIPALRSSDPTAPFPVVLEHALSAPATKASDGTIKLYNMWIFQFNQDGTRNGPPRRLTDEATPINDMVTLEVPLVVATDQTLYLVVMGPKLEYDFSEVENLAALKSISFEYLTEKGGQAESLITADDEIPLAGSVSGVTVMDIDGGSQGLVKYNEPAGFTGGIEIRRLMARITLHYQFDVANYTLQGMKLLNVNRKIRLDNTDALNTEDDSYATLETATDTPDADGSFTSTWYVAQNLWGTVPAIQTESDRYYKVEGTTVSGKAPALGTQIEAWAYTNSSTDQYAIYQMYVGNNNTNNFDVQANHFYNLRTTINTDIASAKNDQRIRTYTAVLRTEFHTSELISGTSDSYNAPGVGYDLDAHYDSRPITVQAQGRNVSLGIYTDQGCTMPAGNAPDNWLQLSSSSNYTEAFNNRQEPLGTSLSATAILPTQLKFYLYNKEYIYAQDGNIPDSESKRSLFLKISTVTTGDGEKVEATHIYRIDQRPALYCGRFGGGRTKDGKSFETGLVCDRISENLTSYTAEKLRASLPAGYRDTDITFSYGAFDMNYGKTVTRKLAENPDNLPVTSNFKNPPKKENGQVLLYQYTYYDTFAARFCYDRNRDEDGNGKIDDDEFKWYLPASGQLFGVNIESDAASWSTTASNAQFSSVYINSNREIGNSGRESTSAIGSARCVRDIDIP